jgi:uncharacterized protein YggU (UPF0235/DUF167 family)
VRVSAAPVEGAANAALRRAVADVLGLAPSEVVIERGARGRRKVLSLPASAAPGLARLMG